MNQNLNKQIDTMIVEQFKREKLLLMKIIADKKYSKETVELAKLALKESKLAYRRYLGQELYIHKYSVLDEFSKLVVQELF